MQKVLPPELKIDVSARPLTLSEATLSRADGAVVLLEKTSQPGTLLDTLMKQSRLPTIMADVPRYTDLSPLVQISEVMVG